jgi:hypothetical protein
VNDAIIVATGGETARVLQFNLLIAWTWILLGFLSGAVLGTRFHHEDWLGGYGSIKRRLYRLGHISFLGLAAMNLLFYFTARLAPMDPATMLWASRGFLIGSFTMPLSCAVMAHFPKTHYIFAVPVVSLLAASVLTITGIVQTP